VDFGGVGFLKRETVINPPFLRRPYTFNPKL